MNRLLVLMGVLLIIGFAWAYTVGQIVTHEQLMGIDIDSFNQNLGVVSETKTTEFFTVRVGLDSLEKNYDSNHEWLGDYTIVRKEKDYSFKMAEYYTCRMTYGVEACKDYAKSFLVKKVKNDLAREKDKLKEWQVEEFYDEFDLTFIPNDFN